MKLLIAYDGSDGAKAALADLTLAGLPSAVDAEILSVADVYPHLPAEFFQDGGGSCSTSSSLADQAKALAQRSLQDARAAAEEGETILGQAFPKWQVRSATCADSPYRALIDRAGQSRADLVVVGSRRESRLTRALLGSVSQKVATHAPCSVRIGRPARAAISARPPRLVIGIDHSVGAAKAVAAVAARRWPPGSSAILVSVVDVRLWTGLAPTLLLGECQDGHIEHLLMKSLNRLERELSEAGLSVSSRVLEGDPASVLIAEAVREEATCAFVGATGLSALGRFVLGSVSLAVAQKCPCTVEIVR